VASVFSALILHTHPFLRSLFCSSFTHIPVSGASSGGQLTSPTAALVGLQALTSLDSVDDVRTTRTKGSEGPSVLSEAQALQAIQMGNISEKHFDAFMTLPLADVFEGGDRCQVLVNSEDQVGCRPWPALASLT
jgi:hypothetical protein